MECNNFDTDHKRRVNYKGGSRIPKNAAVSYLKATFFGSE